MEFGLLDKLQLVMKLRERIRSMEKTPANREEMARLEKLLATFQTQTHVKYI